MTPEQFAYWLQGFNEMSPDAQPTTAQWKMIQEHLALVFTKVTLLRPEQEKVIRKDIKPGPIVPIPPVVPINPWDVPHPLFPDDNLPDKDRLNGPGFPLGPTVIC